MKMMLFCIHSIIFSFLVSPVLYSAPGTGEPGLKWQILDSGSEASLRGLSVAGKELAWASGANATVLRTIDGGKTWQSFKIPGASSGTEKPDFRDIQAWDKDNACVISAGSPALVYKTEDGGKSWKETYRNTHKGIFFDSMAFWDRKNGIAFSDPIDGAFFLIITEDGGQTWKRIPPTCLPVPKQGEAGFAASGTCIAVQGETNAWFCTGGTVARVIYTGDKGKTWKASETPLLSGQPSFGGFGIVFSDARRGVLVGGDYKNEAASEKNAAYTSDGGVTWKAVSTKPPSGFRECAVFVPAIDEDYMVAVGPSGSDFSIDGGITWQRFSDQGFHSAGAAPGTGVLYAVGAKGKIGRLDLLKIAAVDQSGSG